MPSRIDDDVYVAGTLGCRALSIPAGTLTNVGVSASAAIDATKVVHQFPVRYSTASGSAVATASVPVHVVRGATGTVVGVEVTCTTAPTSSDTVTINLHKSTAGGAFATILTGNISLSSSSTARTVYVGTISSADLVDGDILLVVVTVSGTSCQGLCVVVTMRETPA